MVESKKLKMKDKNEAVRVAIRCRPLNSKEISANNVKVVNINKQRNEIIVSKPYAQEEAK